jgi:O-antigen/teichoic acid export membrane protein
MQSNNKLALKAGSWYIISNFLLKGIAIFTTPIFTRLLSPNDFGITNTYSSWLGIITIIGTLDIYSCVQIARHDHSDEEIDSFLSSILTISTVSVILLYILIKLVGNAAIDFIGLPTGLVDIMFLEVLFINAFTIMQTKHKAYFKYKQFVIFSALIAILSPLFAIILISLQDSELYYGKIIGNAIPRLFISFFIFVHILKKGKSFININHWKYALLISVPLIPHHLAGNILNHFDKIMINKYTGSVDTGLYSLGYSYALILSVAWTSFNQAWVPWFYSKMKEKNISDIKKYVKPYMILFTMIFIFMIVIGPEAIKVFGPKEYWNSKWVIPPVLLGIFFQFMYSLFVNIEFYMKKTQFIAIGTIFAAILNVGLNFFFIPIFGYVSAAYTTLAGYLLLFIMHYLISKKWLNEDIYNKRFLFGWMFSVCVISSLIIVFYENTTIRYAVAVTLYISLFIKYRKNLEDFIINVRRR